MRSLLLSFLGAFIFAIGFPAFAHAQEVALPGDLIKGESSSAVYYYYGNRYAFPNEAVYFSWYTDFSKVKTVSNEFLASIPLAANVRFKPGKYMLKIQSDPKVYALTGARQLQWIQTEADARRLYGNDWAKLVRDVDVTFFIDYAIGEPLVNPNIFILEFLAFHSPADSIFKGVDDAARPFSNPEYLHPPEVMEPLKIYRYAYMAANPTTTQGLINFFDPRLTAQGFTLTYNDVRVEPWRVYVRGGASPEIRTLSIAYGLYSYGYIPLTNGTVFYDRSAITETFQDQKHTVIHSWTLDTPDQVKAHYLQNAPSRGWQFIQESNSVRHPELVDGNSMKITPTLYFKKPGTLDWMVVAYGTSTGSVFLGLGDLQTNITVRTIDARD